MMEIGMNSHKYQYFNCYCRQKSHKIQNLYKGYVRFMLEL